MDSLVQAIAIVVAIWVIAIASLALLGRGTAARELATFVPNVALLFKGLLGDPRVPFGAKVALGVGLVWIASPIDLIPEFIPVAGPLDDAIVAALVLRYVLSVTSRETLDAHWRGAPSTLQLVVRLAQLGRK